MTQDEAQQRLDDLAEIAGGFLDIADACVKRNACEEALRWNQMAARVLATQNRDLSSARIESNLQFLAGQIPVSVSARKGPADRPTLLHVFTRALPHGGHTAMSVRWMKLEDDRIHHAALLAQNGPAPDELIAAARASGGDVHEPDAGNTFVERAAWLRKLASQIATHVVLHVDVDDVIPAVAFGVMGGPPVMLLNHAAHLYWVGSSVADLVLNCRGSDCEMFWTRTYRGVSRCATVTIPLTAPAGVAEDDTVRQSKREFAKHSLGIAKDSVLIFTSGESYKYAPFGPLDFLAVCEGILREAPNACIIAAGPQEDERWKAASQRTAGRLRTVGRQSREQMSVLQNAADIYIEGFPFGSTTALFEAGMRGVPVVVSPAQCPPPFGTDGIALDHVLKRATSLEDYARHIVLLAANEAERCRLGRAVRESILRHHTGEGWKQHVDAAIAALPLNHCVYPPAEYIRTPDQISSYWTRLRSILHPCGASVWEEWAAVAFAEGLRPRTDGFSKPRDSVQHRAQATLCAAIAERYYSAGDPAMAREFYRISIECNPWNFRVRSKQVLLSLGGPGQFVRRSLRQLCGRAGALN